MTGAIWSRVDHHAGKRASLRLDEWGATESIRLLTEDDTAGTDDRSIDLLFDAVGRDRFSLDGFNDRLSFCDD